MLAYLTRHWRRVSISINRKSHDLQDAFDEVHFCLVADAGQVSVILILTVKTRMLLICRERGCDKAVAIIVVLAGRTERTL